MNKDICIKEDMCQNEYTTQKIRSLKFYQGVTEVSDVAEHLKEFYSTPKAYRTINALMYDGIENEITRVSKEQQKLSPELLCNISEIVKIYKDIFGLMNRNMRCQQEREITCINAYRTERKSALELLNKGQTISLTSTSKINDFKEYFRKKDGLLILEFKITGNIPYVDVNEVVGNQHSFSAQQEILLPPFLNISLLPKQLTERELGYRDINGNPPVGKYEVNISKTLPKIDVNINEEEHLRERLEDSCSISNAMRVLELINGCQDVSEKEETEYIKWKYCFQKLIKIYFKKYILDV